MSTVVITVIESQNEQSELLEQLYSDVAKHFNRIVCKPVPAQAIEIAVQDVILHSAFQDGFYFEGDVLKAVNNTIYSALEQM